MKEEVNVLIPLEEYNRLVKENKELKESNYESIIKPIERKYHRQIDELRGAIQPLQAAGAHLTIENRRLNHDIIMLKAEIERLQNRKRFWIF